MKVTTQSPRSSAPKASETQAKGKAASKKASKARTAKPHKSPSPALPSANPFDARVKGTQVTSQSKGAGDMLNVRQSQDRAAKKRSQLAAPTPQTHPQRFTSTGELKWKVAPPGVEVQPNSSGSGAWIERWRSPKTDKWVYNYTNAFMNKRALNKFRQNKDFGAKLGNIKKQLRADLQSDGKERMLAAVVGCIQDAYFRVGNPSSAKQGVFGITTLQQRHIRFENNTAIFEYIGKKKTAQHRVVSEPSLVAALRQLVDSAKGSAADAPLFSWQGQGVSNRQVNEYLEQFGVTAKQFRTYHATRLCRRGLLDRGSVPKGERAKVVSEVVTRVAQKLGHSEAVCRASYIDPMVIQAFEAGRLQ